MPISDQSKSYLEKLVRIAENSPKALSYESITVDGTVKRLTVPVDATYAYMTLESADTGVAARYLETTSITVSNTIGLPLVNLQNLDILDYQNLVNFQITRVQSGATTLKVQYYR